VRVQLHFRILYTLIFWLVLYLVFKNVYFGNTLMNESKFIIA